MNNDLTPGMKNVLKYLATLQDKGVNRQQLERQLKIDGSELAIILNKMVNNGYVKTTDKAIDEGIVSLLFSLTPTGMAKAKSLS